MKNSHLPIGHKFTLYRDEDGDYILESQEERGLAMHGSTADEVVAKMAEIILEWENMSELARGYVANSKNALKIAKEFEPLQIEAISTADNMR